MKVLARRKSGGRRIFRAPEFCRIHRLLLVDADVLHPVIRGWLVCADALGADGSQQRRSVFWEFCAAYFNHRFHNAWHLSAEQSIRVHAGNYGIPSMVKVVSPSGSGNQVRLSFGCTLLDYAYGFETRPGQVVTLGGLRALSVPAALLRLPARLFPELEYDARAAIGRLDVDGSLWLRLLEGEGMEAAGRLTGALRQAGKEAAADQILSACRQAGYRVRENDPFGGVTDLWHAVR